MTAGIALFLAAYALWTTIRLVDARRERDEAIAKYDATYALGHAAGLMEARSEYRARVPWQDGFDCGYRQCEMDRLDRATGLNTIRL